MDYRIMLVEDMKDVQDALARFMRVLDKRVVVTCYDNGLRALSALQQLKPEEHPHLVLTDTEMPQMGGLQLVEKIKELYPSVPVVRMSGNPATKPDLDKPIELPTLADLLKKYEPQTK